MLDLSKSIVYDMETLPNCITIAMEELYSGVNAVWEISEYRDDRRELLQFLQYLAQSQIPMIGFNNLGFDYPIIHEFWKNPNINYTELYSKSQQIIEDGKDKFKTGGKKNNFAHSIWASDMLTPQIDVFKINHFDNIAKTASLKSLEIMMRSHNVVEMPIPHSVPVSKYDTEKYLIPYNKHDVSETKKFTLYTIGTIEFRNNLIERFGVEVMNWNDTKIGEQLVIKELGDELCFDRSSGKKVKRQTPRHRVVINDIIFPYIQFEHPEFNRILEYLKTQILKPDEFKTVEEGEIVQVKTKGVFKNLVADVGGIPFKFGTGGIHASMTKQKILAGGGYLIRDIDVKSLYPEVGRVNRLAPEHLGEKFVNVYAQLPVERAFWQEKKGKKCAEANSFKLGGNGAYGKSNSVFSPLFDPQFTMTITVNGQLMLCMLAEKLIKIPTVQLIQCNTDGITYYIHENHEPEAAKICKEWEDFTLLTLEAADYSAMYIRDVGSYVAIGTDKTVKLKGAYWTPCPMNYHKSIMDAQPPAWHKNPSNYVSARAAIAHMVYGVDIMEFLKSSIDPYDFINAVKIRRSDKLMWNGQEQQRNTRFYIANNGFCLTKILPAQGVLGMFKKANGITDHEYKTVMDENGGVWDERVCTKNKSKYNIRENSIMAGQKVVICNNMDDFDFGNINYNWYLQEALKLVV